MVFSLRIITAFSPAFIIIQRYEFKPAVFIIPITGLLLVISIGMIPYQFSLPYYHALQEIPQIKELDQAGFKLEAKHRLLSISPILKDHSEYLDLYSFQLMAEGKTEEAITVLNKLLKKSVSNHLYMRLGNAYLRTGNYQKAEETYQMSIFMVPNRFQSRYQLYKLYKQTKQYQKALACANSILALPVKIPSYEINKIKMELMKN